MATFVWEAGIDVKDMLPASGDMRSQILALDEAKVQAYLFRAAIHQDGDTERTYIKKQEMQHSKVGQMLLPFWSQLDSDPDSKVTEVEWNQFFENLKKSELGKELAMEGHSLIVDLFVDGGYDIGDVQ